MSSMRFFTIGVVTVFTLSNPSGAQGDPGGCTDALVRAPGLAVSGALPGGGCPKVLVYSANGHVSTACVLYLTDDDHAADERSRPLGRYAEGEPERATFSALLAD